MIKVLFIPADDNQPITVKECPPTWSALYALVGGGPSDVELPETGCSMFCNGSGKLLNLDQNFRATLIADQYDVGFAKRDYIAGDAIIYGDSVDGENPSSASDLFLQRAF